MKSIMGPQTTLFLVVPAEPNENVLDGDTVFIARAPDDVVENLIVLQASLSCIQPGPSAEFPLRLRRTIWSLPITFDLRLFNLRVLEKACPALFQALRAEDEYESEFPDFDLLGFRLGPTDFDYHETWFNDERSYNIDEGENGLLRVDFVTTEPWEFRSTWHFHYVGFPDRHSREEVVTSTPIRQEALLRAWKEPQVL